MERVKNGAPALYHYVPDDLVGETLYPLNRLAKLHPTVAAEHARKYTDREHLMKVRLPVLDCLWNDVLHFSPLHPALTKASLQACGFQPSPRRFFVIPPELLDSHRAVYFKHSRDTQGAYDFLASDFMAFAAESYQELESIPAEQSSYFQRMKETGGTPLLWARTPHVFYLGDLPIKNLPTVEW